MSRGHFAQRYQILILYSITKIFAVYLQVFLFLEYKDAFRNFDQNGDGKISCKELRTFLKSMGQNPSDADVKKIMTRADKDGILLSLYSVIKILYLHRWLMVSVLASSAQIVGSSPRRVKLKTKKIVFFAPLLSTQH